MMTSSHIELTLRLCDPEADEEELDRKVRSLRNELADMDEVAAVERIADPNIPEHSKAGGNFLIDLLRVDISPANCLKVLTFLGDRLGNKPLKLKVKTPSGKELELEASSREEFAFVMQQAQAFLENV
ncbi:hypothetical protein ACN4EK_22340 [Pantanalinema rosaneae CENA516]|uniref:hypothetical protein n=1 Tax=Pantanalinema rosaneae TaxID=1620701 RepID=UPI003D6EF24E